MTDFQDQLTKWNGGKRGAARRFAAKIGKHEVTVGEWCRGVKSPGAEVMPEIARVLKVTVDDVADMFPTRLFLAVPPVLARVVKVAAARANLSFSEQLLEFAAAGARLGRKK